MSLELTPTKFRALCTAAALNYPTLTPAGYFQGEMMPERFCDNAPRHRQEGAEGALYGEDKAGVQNKILILSTHNLI